MTLSATYASSSTFTVSGDYTAQYEAGRSVLLYPGVIKVFVESSSYGAPNTTVTVTPSSVPVGLTNVKLGATSKNSTGKHGHTGNDDGGHMEAADLSAAEVAWLQNQEIATTGDDDKLLRVTNSEDGTELIDLLGTTNQITVTHNVSDITLSIPQNIHTAASPTFAGITLSGLTGFLYGNAGSAVTVYTASGALQVLRRNAGNDGYEFGDVIYGDISDVTITSAAEGDTIYRNGSSAWVNLAIGDEDQYFKVSSGVPAWVNGPEADQQVYDFLFWGG